MSATPLYLEDLSVGQRYRSGEHALDAAQIKAFAAQFDPQPFHLDDDLARATLFGGLAASGWHTAAVTMRLLVGSGMTLADGVIGAGGELRWPIPTRPGDVLHCDIEVLEIHPSKSRPERGMVLVQVLTLNQTGQAVQEMKARLVVGRRPKAQ